MNDEERALITLWARGVSALNISDMLERHGGAAAALAALPARLREGGAGRDADGLVEDARRYGARIVTRASAGYPAPLLNIPDPPAALYIKGAGDIPFVRAAAIAGTRSVSSYGREVARLLGDGLARHGVTVVTGLSDGVDAIAAEACLDAGGAAVGVLATGINEIYPGTARALFGRMAASGALISEFFPQARPRAASFHARNRLVSGLASVVILVEGTMTSGAALTVGHAAEQGREVMAVPGNITSPGSALPNDLIRQGVAPALDVFGVLEHMGWGARPKAADKGADAPVSGLSPHEKQVLEALRIEPLPFETLLEKTGLNVSVLNSLLTRLELRGIIRQSAGRVFERAVL